MKKTRLPRDPNARAVAVAKLATGETELPSDAPDKLVPGRRAGGLKGGRARAASLTPEERRKIAKKAAEARWRGAE